MKLDYNPDLALFFIQADRREIDVHAMMDDYGFEFSATASTAGVATLFTAEPYAAATFANIASPEAFKQLAWMSREIEASRALSSQRHVECPPDQELWPFQLADLDYMLQRPRGSLDCDEPGLGKTPTAICYANEIQAKRVLVVCPASIRFQWFQKIQIWATRQPPDGLRFGRDIYCVTTSRYGVHPHAQWTVVSWDLVRSPGIWKALAAAEYDLIILDEAHYAKNGSTARARAVFGGGANPPAAPLMTRAPVLIGLTGTPLPNRPREAYTLMRGINWGAADWMSEDRFEHRFNASRKIEVEDKTTGEMKMIVDERSGRHSELQNRLRANMMTRHLKREVMPQLKMPLYDLIQVEETSAVKQALFAESLLHIDPEDLEGSDMTILGPVATARRVMGLAIAPQVADYAKMLILGGETKIVLFAWHIEVLDLLEGALAGLGTVRIDGRHTAKQKETLKQLFINDEHRQIMLGNLLSLGTGTDGLQYVSNHALIAEPSWTPGENVQAFDRLDRGGQTRVVQGDIFVAPGSISEKILAKALRKLNVTYNSLDRDHGVVLSGAVK